MALKIATQRRYSWPVKVHRANDGRFDTYQFTAHFESLTTPELEELTQSGQTSMDLVRKKLVGWEDVKDADGAPLEFNEQHKELALADLDVLRGLVRAILESATGGPDIKN